MKFDFEKSRLSIKKAIVGLLAFVLIAGQSGITSMADWVDVDGDESYSEGDISGNAYVGWEKRGKKAMPGDSCTFEVSQEDIVLEKYVKDEEGWADWEIFSDEDWENVELQYQWYKVKWDEETEEEIYEIISGATEAFYTIYDIKAEDFQVDFECKVSVKYCTDEPQTAIIGSTYFWLEPDIGFEGVDEDDESYEAIYTKNKSGVLNVDVKCTNEQATLEYKWYENGKKISGANSNSYKFSIEDESYSKYYYCIIKATVDGVSKSCYCWFDIYRYDIVGTFVENSSMQITIPEDVHYGYTFTPSQTAEYTFYTNPDNMELYGEMLDDEGDNINLQYIDEEDDWNKLKFKVELEANRTYIFIVGSYENREVTFTMTNTCDGSQITECLHTNTSVIDAKEATYLEEGYTGDVYCNDCKTIIEKGQIIKKKECAHANMSVVNKRAATCLREGYTGDTFCNDCKTVIKKGETIAKISATISLNVKGTIPLKIKQSTTAVKVSYGSGDGIASWKSSNTKIATVSSKGKITGKKAGTATITVVLKSGKSKSFKVKVQKKEVATTKVTVNSKNVVLKKGGKFTVKTTLAPITSVQKVKYTSSNKKVATVSSKGVITAKKKGTAKITVTSGKKKVTIKVTVK